MEDNEEGWAESTPSIRSSSAMVSNMVDSLRLTTRTSLGGATSETNLDRQELAMVEIEQEGWRIAQLLHVSG